ncbi:PP2C family protein-serine/threonine phosphatase [Streptomyces populi]
MSRYASQYPGVPGSEVAERFITALLAEIPDEEPVVRTVTCGQPPPLLLHRGEVRELQPAAPSPPLNLGMLVSNGHHLDFAPLHPGDQLLLYPDGVTETRDRSDAFYPLAERIRSWGGETSHQLLEHLHRDLLAYSGDELDDGIAALVARRRTSHRACGEILTWADALELVRDACGRAPRGAANRPRTPAAWRPRDPRLQGRAASAMHRSGHPEKACSGTTLVRKKPFGSLSRLAFRPQRNRPESRDTCPDGSLPSCDVVRP